MEVSTISLINQYQACTKTFRTGDLSTDLLYLKRSYLVSLSLKGLEFWAKRWITSSNSDGVSVVNVAR